MLEVDERGQHLQPVLVERLGVRAAHELDGLGLEVVVDGLQLGEDLLHVLVVLVVEEDWVDGNMYLRRKIQSLSDIVTTLGRGQNSHNIQ